MVKHGSGGGKHGSGKHGGGSDQVSDADRAAMTSVAEFTAVVLAGSVRAAIAWLPFDRDASSALLNPRHAVWRTPLAVASRIGHADMVGALIGLGARADYADRAMGFTALHHAAHAPFDLADDVIKRLVCAGGDVNAVARSTGATPLHEAVRGNRWANAMALLGHGAGPSMAVADAVFGWTPLHWAMNAQDAAAASTLLTAASAHLTRDVLLARDHEGNTALHIALECGADNAHALVITLHRLGLLQDALAIQNAEGRVPDLSGAPVMVVRVCHDASLLTV